MKELLDRFMKTTDQNFSDVKGSMKEMNDKIDGLMAFKWKSLGISIAILVIVNYAIRLGVFK